MGPFRRHGTHRVLEAELPEGASVTVLALEGDETFETDAETEKVLLEAIAQGEVSGVF